MASIAELLHRKIESEKLRKQMAGSSVQLEYDQSNIHANEIQPHSSGDEIQNVEVGNSCI